MIPLDAGENKSEQSGQKPFDAGKNKRKQSQKT